MKYTVQRQIVGDHFSPRWVRADGKKIGIIRFLQSISCWQFVSDDKNIAALGVTQKSLFQTVDFKYDEFKKKNTYPPSRDRAHFTSQPPVYGSPWVKRWVRVNGELIGNVEYAYGKDYKWYFTSNDGTLKCDSYSKPSLFDKIYGEYIKNNKRFS